MSTSSQCPARRAILIGAAAVLAGGASAYANGDDFFRAGEAIGDTALVFVGTVKDAEGEYVKGVAVRWEATLIADDGEHHVGFETFTNAIGHYRTVNIARAVAALDFALDPDRVEVTARKDGYTMVSRLHRGTSKRKMGVIEINFTVKKNPAPVATQ